MLNGIRKNNVGQWVAFRNGKPVGWHSGPGSKANAITEAGSNRVLTDDDFDAAKRRRDSQTALVHALEAAAAA